MSVLGSTVRNGKEKKEFYTGLTCKEAKKRLAKYGSNAIVSKKKISPLKILMDQFKDFTVLILLAATAISMFMGETTEAITIIIIVAVNAILGFIQEYRTERTMEALKGLAAPTSNVIRDGKILSIPAEEIVPGDVILLESGDRVTADGFLIEATNLQVDESLLTGESVPVEKGASNSGTEARNPDEKKASVYMGTIVTGGRGKAVVGSTGMATEMGKIADMIEGIEDEETPLQRRLEYLGKFIAYGCLIICAVVSITGILRGEALFEMFLAGISLAVAAVPEGLPAIVTIALALGVQRMMKRNALIRKLPAVETLGCASVICSDKTGTLTENRMTVRKIYAGDHTVDVQGNAVGSQGQFYAQGKEVKPEKIEELKLALEISGVCNNASMVKAEVSGGALSKIKSVFSKKAQWEIHGDPTEGALLAVAAKAGLSSEVLNQHYERVDEIPFDSDRKCMSVICRNRYKENLVLTKGAPDVILDKCTKILTSKGVVSLTPSIKSRMIRINEKMAGDALRVIGVAYRKLHSDQYKNTNVESDLTFVGLMGMIDPPRKEALEAVQKCRLAGIKPVMITGDHKATATAIAKELTIFTEGDHVLTGTDLEGMSDRELEKVAHRVAVYARVSPKHKLKIVRVLKKLGHVVAMTGDGVNDAPAVKEADIGISMGVTGTDVTKEASSMILMDDNFATIVAAVEEGRVIYNNIRKFIRYMLACNIGEVLTMFLGMLIGLPLPLLPIQILWVNLVTDGLPAIALGLDPAEKDIMKRPPRSAKENIFSQGLLKLILVRGVLIGLCTLAVFASIYYFTGKLDHARTAAFVTLVMTQLIHVFECKSEKKNIFEVPFFNNMLLVLAVLCSLVMILGVIYIPFFQGIFKTVPMTLNDWILIMGFSALGPVLSSFMRLNKR